MEFTEVLGNLSVSPVSAEFIYEDEDHICWQLKYSSTEMIRITAGIKLNSVRENRFLDMVRQRNKDNYSFMLDEKTCLITHQTVLTTANELYRRLPEISASLLGIALFMERMCSCVE